MKKEQQPGKRLLCLFLLIALTFSFLSFSSNAESISPSRNRVVRLRSISSAKAIEYLKEFNIDCVASQLPPNTLLLTAGKGDITKAASLMRLVDSEDAYVMLRLVDGLQAEEMPKNEDIESQLDDVAVGNFLDFPEDGKKQKAIIDVHDGNVVAIATEQIVEEIKEFVEKYMNPEVVEANDVQVIESNDAALEVSADVNDTLVADLNDVATADANEVLTGEEKSSDDLFSELIESLEDANAVQQEVNELEELMLEKLAAVESSIVEEVEEVIETPAEEVAEAEELQEAEAETEEEVEQDSGFARRSYEPEYSELADMELELDLPEKIMIVELIDLVGKYLQLDYMFDPEEIKGEVTLRVQGPIKVRELYPLLESVMKFKDFVMSRKGNFVTITLKAKVLEIDPVLLDGDISVKAGDVIVTRAFELEYVGTETAKTLLEEMQLGASISQIKDTGTLIVTEYAYRMERIENILKMIDKPGEPKEFRFRQLKYTMAENLAEKVKALVEQMGEISITIAKTPATAARPTPVRGRVTTPKPTAATATEAEGPSVYLDADARTNRILMIGLESQLEIVEDFVDSLDVAQQDLRALQMYEIQFVGAEEVQQKLVELGIITEVTTKRPTTSRTTTSRTTAGRTTTPQPATSAASYGEEGKLPSDEPQVVLLESTNSLLVNATPEQHIQIATIIGYVDMEPEKAAIPYVVYPLENQDPVELKAVLDQLIQETIQEQQDKEAKIQTTAVRQRTEDEVVVVSDEKTYSLIVYANKKNQQWVSSLIRELDQYRPQVLLDVTLVAVTKNDSFTFDLDLVTKIPSMAAGGSMVSGTIEEGVSALVDAFPDGRVMELSSRKGVGRGFYSDEQIQVLLKAEKVRNWGRILSNPQLLVDDNVEAKITQDRTIYITETKVTTTSTTTTPSTQTDISFTPYTAGLELMIKPHISKGDQLRLEIYLKRNDFDGAPTDVSAGGQTVQKPADERKNEIESTVTVPDGYTVILGGIQTANQAKAGSKIPLLGDLPLIGGLFNSIHDGDEQSRLYIFVKAHILRPSEIVDENTDIVRVSRKNKQEFEQLERDFQEKEDWPGLKPKPIDPVHILEED